MSKDSREAAESTAGAALRMGAAERHLPDMMAMSFARDKKTSVFGGEV